MAPRQQLLKRTSLAEWAATILLLVFATTAVAQPFVIPTGSMQDTLLIGDHLLVDKLAYAPAGRISKFLLPTKPRSTAISSFFDTPQTSTKLW